MTAAAPALYTTGLLMYTVNFLFARLTFAPFYQGYRPSVLVRSEFAEMLPPFLAMLALGVVTAVLIGPLGVFALAPLAVVVVVPQLALAHLGRDRSVTRLSPPEATRVYAAAIADVLGLPRGERRTVANAAALLGRESPRRRRPTGGISSIRTRPSWPPSTSTSAGTGRGGRRAFLAPGPRSPAACSRSHEPGAS